MRKNLLRYSIVLIMFVAFGLVLLFSGCAARTTTVTNLPPNVTQAQVQAWDKAVANLDKIAQSVSAMRQIAVPLCTQTVTTSAGTSPVLAPGTCDLILMDIGRIDQAEIAATRFLQAVPNTWGTTTASQIATWTGAITAALNELNTTGLAGIKNANSQQEVAALLLQIADGVAAISIL